MMRRRRLSDATAPLEGSLQKELLMVFERACREQDFAVADHLLAALETIARRQDDEEQLVPAYLIFADACMMPACQAMMKQSCQDLMQQQPK